MKQANRLKVNLETTINVDCTLFRGGADEVEKLMKKSSVTRRISKCLVKGCIDDSLERERYCAKHEPTVSIKV